VELISSGSGISLECGALGPLWYQSADKSAHSKEAPGAFCAFLWQHSFLVAYFERKLDHSRTSAGRCDASESRRHGDVAVWIGEVGPVKKIEELGAQLRPDAFIDRDKLYHGKVESLLSWSIK
jgi:hypothetical protein